MGASLTKKILFFFLVSQQITAFAGNVPVNPTTNTNTSGASKGVETSGGTQNGASVNQGANQTASANKSAQAQQYIQGAMMFGMAASHVPGCSSGSGVDCGFVAMYTGLGVLSMKQGSEHGKAVRAAGLTGYQSNGFGSDPYAFDGINLKDPNNPLSKDSSIKNLGSNWKKISSFYNEKTGKITTPDGKSYNASDFGSVDGMAAAGMSKGAIDGALAMYDEVQKKAAAKLEKLKLGALTAASGFEEGGGSKGGGAAPGESLEDPSLSLASAKTSSGIDRDPSNFAGMQKNYNGDPIGVAADSIFQMIARRYKMKESQESFYTDMNQ
ncbi:hypothetical protein [Bdellovibrio bacteriovorus]|uniref:hypothetical protein n=1 Tax=Bdellovibrio TaxID=958 RepID=UPI0035A92D3F